MKADLLILLKSLLRTAAFALTVLLCLPGFSQTRSRTELTFPDVPGYQTLRCDFHMHTVFSDGNVWPGVRVEEAWRDGLDAIALTDHLEYLPHKADLGTNYGRPYEIASGAARSLGIVLIRSAEITRGEPPGHVNAIGLTNLAVVNQTDNTLAVSNAFIQGAFLFWNHPGWKQPQNKSVWYKEQDEFLQRGWLRGIEIVNGSDYDPIAHQWCLDKKLTMLGDSDAHDPIGFEYGNTAADRRPVTLVFATERSPKGIREALVARRTAVLSQDRLIGEPEYLNALFQGSIEILNPDLRIQGKGRVLVQLRNKAPLNFECRLSPKLPECDVPAKLTLLSRKVSLLEVRCVSDRVKGEQEVAIPCRVTNLLVQPTKGLSTSLRLKIRFEGSGN